jgi:hypothetical protein
MDCLHSLLLQSYHRPAKTSSPAFEREQQVVRVNHIMQSVAGAFSIMKRKLSEGPDPAAPAHSKKVAGNVTRACTQPCHLLQLLTQYGVLVTITSYLFPRDLYALAATSKTAYRSIFTCRESHGNLLAKMACDGRGVALRWKHHNDSGYRSDPSILRSIQCPAIKEDVQNQPFARHFRSEMDGQVPARPCTACKHMTCDECRIHCVFQTTWQAAETYEEVPTMTGFALLSSQEMGILTPFALGVDDRATRLQQEIVGLSVPYHDEGYLEAPLTSDIYANPESIDEIIDFALGRASLRLSDESTAPHPSSVIRPFWEVTEERKWSICPNCVEEWRKGAEDIHCRCTLREHFVSRWLCLPCYKQEVEATRQLAIPSAPKKGSSACNNCGDRFDTQSLRTMCTWCLGECLEMFLSLRT